jgi:hypothetical protein
MRGVSVRPWKCTSGSSTPFTARRAPEGVVRPVGRDCPRVARPSGPAVRGVLGAAPGGCGRKKPPPLRDALESSGPLVLCGDRPREYRPSIS